ncbi:MAG: hypothetical protein ACI8RD_013824, partial [Bacillariaceae sp.]
SGCNHTNFTIRNKNHPAIILCHAPKEQTSVPEPMQSSIYYLQYTIDNRQLLLQ